MSDDLKPVRVIVCGGRDFTDYERVASVLDRLHAMRPFWGVWHGNARGADTCADRWCRERGVKVFPVPAQWSKHGRRAGPLRNQAMLGNGIDLVVAFPGGAGTEDMVKRAHDAGVLVTRARAKSVLRDANASPDGAQSDEATEALSPAPDAGATPGMNP